MRSYSPGGVLNALATAQQASIPATPSTHRLQRGLPGYLIPFAPHAFAYQRQLRSREPPSPQVFLPISTHFTATLGTPLSSPALKSDSIKRTSSVEPRAFTPDLSSRLHAFTPSNSEQRLPPPYYRGCWHGVSRGLFLRYRQSATLFELRLFFPQKRALHPKGLHRSRGVAGSGFRPLPKFPHCCLP